MTNDEQTKPLPAFIDTLPKSYKFNQLIRWATILIGLFAFCYAFWIAFFSGGIDGGSGKIAKAIPFLIMFFALNSLIRNLFSINKVTLTRHIVQFSQIVLRPKEIFIDSIKKMEIVGVRARIIKISYNEIDNDKLQEFSFSISFPNILEILNGIYEISPQIELDSFLKSALSSPSDKKDFEDISK